VADPLAVVGVREARRAVRKQTLVLLLANRKAEVRPLVAAVDALAALRREERHDVVAGRERRDAVAHALDDAGALVPEHGRRVTRGVRSRGREEVGVADAAGDEPDESLARLRLGELHLPHGERCAEVLQHRGAHPHPAIVFGTLPAQTRTCSAARARERLPYSFDR
jgi:hypothetical protein